MLVRLLKYVGESFDVDSLTNGKIYEITGEEGPYYRVIDDSDEDSLYSKTNPAPIDGSSPGGHWEETSMHLFQFLMGNEIALMMVHDNNSCVGTVIGYDTPDKSIDHYWHIYVKGRKNRVISVAEPEVFDIVDFGKDKGNFLFD